MKQGDIQHFGVTFEIAVGGKNFPFSPGSSGTNQEIDRRAGDPGAAASIRHPGSLLVVVRGQNNIIEIPQAPAHFLKLRVIGDAGEQFLANGPDYFGQIFPGQFSEMVPQTKVGSVQVFRLAAKSQGPDRRVDEDSQPRVLPRSAL